MNEDSQAHPSASLAKSKKQNLDRLVPRALNWQKIGHRDQKGRLGRQKTRKTTLKARGFPSDTYKKFRSKTENRNKQHVYGYFQLTFKDKQVYTAIWQKRLNKVKPFSKRFRTKFACVKVRTKSW
jgi:hypothetical protein